MRGKRRFYVVTSVFFLFFLVIFSILVVLITATTNIFSPGEQYFDKSKDNFNCTEAAEFFTNESDDENSDESVGNIKTPKSEHFKSKSKENNESVKSNKFNDPKVQRFNGKRNLAGRNIKKGIFRNFHLIKSGKRKSFDTGGQAFDAKEPENYDKDNDKVRVNNEDNEDENEASDDPHGFLADYYKFDNILLSDFPNMSQVPWSYSRIETDINYQSDANFNLPFAAEAFYARYIAVIEIEKEGNFSFFVTTNGQARLFVDDKLVLEKTFTKNDPEGSVNLAAGSHLILLEFFDNYGDTTLILTWKHSSNEWSAIPYEILTPVHTSERDINGVAISNILPERPQAMRQIIITGETFCEIPTYNKVVFKPLNQLGIAKTWTAEVRSITRNQIVAVVPDITGQFEVVVKVGPDYSPVQQVSEPKTVEIFDAIFGLVGRYYFFEEKLNGFPNVSKTSPDVIRLDKVVNFNSEHSFLLPFKIKYFYAYWEGFVEIKKKGYYTFYLDRTNQARWFFNNKEYPVYTQIELQLEPGFYPVKIEFYTNGTYPVCRFKYFEGKKSDVPGDRYFVGEECIVPSDILWTPPEFLNFNSPRIQEINPKKPRAGHELEIIGQGFGSTNDDLKVWFLTHSMNWGGFINPGEAVLADIKSASKTKLNVVVPAIAGPSLIIVSVNGLISEGYEAEIEAILGLLAEYHELEQTATKQYDWDSLGNEFQVDFLAMRILDKPKLELLPEYVRAPFTVRYSGKFWAKNEGDYHFEFSVSGALRLKFNNVIRINKNFSGSGTVVGSFEQKLTAGFYDFELIVTSNAYAPHLESKLKYNQGDFRDFKLDDFLPPDDFTSRERPVITKITPEKPSPGQLITIEGNNFTGDNRKAIVLTGSANVKKYLSVTENSGKLEVALPNDLQPGPLYVAVDGLSSEPYILELSYPTQSGLRGVYYNFSGNESYSTMPDVSGKKPALIRRDMTINFPNDKSFNLYFIPENYAIVWEGWLHAPVEGTYRFTLGSDDGSKLFVNNIQVINNDGIHAYYEVEGDIQLTAGYHKIKIEFFENYGAANCIFYWQKPGTSKREVVPQTNLFEPNFTPPGK